MTSAGFLIVAAANSPRALLIAKIVEFVVFFSFFSFFFTIPYSEMLKIQEIKYELKDS